MTTKYEIVAIINYILPVMRDDIVVNAWLIIITSDRCSKHKTIVMLHPNLSLRTMTFRQILKLQLTHPEALINTVNLV